MAGYVGNIPVPQGTQTRQSFTATASQTSFPTIGYTAGFIDVYLNGVKLIDGTDFTASNGSDVVLTTAAAADDVLNVVIFDTFDTSSGTFSATTLKNNVTLKNDTEEDTDGGRASKIIYQGEQSGGEISTLAEIEASHDGTADDEKGDLIFRTNDGSDGASPSERMRIDSVGTTSITVTGNEDTLNLISTDADSSFGPVLNLHRNSASPANSDSTGRINFQAENDADEKITYAQIFTSLQNVADGSEDGRLKLGTMGGGNFNSRMDMTNTETVFNEDSKDLNFRIESDGNTNMLFVDAGVNSVLIGKNSSNSTVDGVYFQDLGSGFFHGVITNSTSISSYSTLYLNRHASDGTLIAFRQADSTEGSVSVSGSTVSFNGFSGRHESSGIPTNTPVGTVVSTIDELDVYPDTALSTDGNTVAHNKAGQTRADHAKVEVSNSEGDPCVYGVVAEFNDDGKLIVTSVGIGSVRVTGACSKGDLLESNGDGTAKVQSDDIIRSKTIGKVTIGNSNTDVKLVSCVMYCG